MKTIFRFLSLAVLAAGFIAAGNTSGFAQDACADVDGQTALYTKFTGVYGKNDEASLTTAVESGKQFLEKYGACETVKEQADYLKKAVPALETQLKTVRERAATGALLKRFDTAVQSKSYDDAYVAGGEFISKFPDHPTTINLAVTLGQIGVAESYPPKKNYKYNNDTLKYAKMAIDQLNAGAKPKADGTYGVFQFSCANKEDCISQLTYGQAFITYYAQDNKQAALPIFYHVTQLPGSAKNNPAIYGTLGDYYFIDVKRLADEVQAKIKELQAAPDADKPAKDAEVKAKIAELNGYAERALDYYSRAYKMTKDDAASKAYKDGIYNQITGIYNVRTGSSDKAKVDAYIAQAVTKPLPDPTSPVTPVSDPEAAKDASSTSGSAAATAPATTPTATPKPATPAANKPAVPTKPSSVNGGATTAKKAGAATASKAKPGVRKAGSNSLT
jgi:tetratricopeptide (TPR) repeat protein